MSLSLPPAPNEVVTLHDVVAWRFPDEGAVIRSAGAELRAARAVICVSQATADDAQQLLGLTNTHVVYPGISEDFRNARPLDPGRLRELSIKQPYIVHAGGASNRKNLGALADAWSVVARECPELSLVLSGPPHPHRTALFSTLPRTRLIGRTGNADVPGLLAGATALVVPSLHEGFGLPVLEGMAAGVPVVAANSTSLPEVAGGAALLVPPTAEGVADGLLAILRGKVDVERMISHGRARSAEFTWERCLDRHAAIWRAAAEDAA
ncbi:glycosyltransferase family 1 protein [Microbacterium horticulturae]|uniref:Glycosyltransferase family 1 protein n=1 Tax=Microbacterium horticulturae TaxID=3028316 RepID=A0ABY8BYD5_9MICO|nr:glycosyltransferase family 1 protein [Microbacterium sp. KACC 23027]WEG09184.1 glycosyltransferase family 1 protein [Microbacterium sp. KACC 23027]